MRVKIKKPRAIEKGSGNTQTFFQSLRLCYGKYILTSLGLSGNARGKCLEGIKFSNLTKLGSSGIPPLSSYCL